jgi:hypothetical protein
MLQRIGHWCYVAGNDQDSTIELNGLAIPKDIVETCSQRFTASLFDDYDGYFPRSWRAVLKRRMGGNVNEEELDLLLAEAGQELDDALLVATILFERYCFGSR